MSLTRPPVLLPGTMDRRFSYFSSLVAPKGHLLTATEMDEATQAKGAKIILIFGQGQLQPLSVRETL